MNRCTCDLRKDLTAHELADSEACKCKKKCACEVGVVGLHLLVISCKLLRTTDQGLLITGQGRNLLTERVQRCGSDDTEDVCDGQYDDREGIVVRCRITGYLLINLGERNGTCTITTTHDRKCVLDQGICKRNTEDGTCDTTENRCCEKSAEDRRDITREGTDQDVTLE